MIVICEKDRVNIAISLSKFAWNEKLSIASSDLLKKDNFPAWRIKGRKNTIMAAYCDSPSADILRYKKGLFDKEINEETLRSYTIDVLRKISEEYAAINIGCEIATRLVVACGDRAYKIAKGVVLEVCDFFVDGADSSFIEGALARYKDLDCDARLKKTSQIYKNHFGVPLAPYGVIDTRNNSIRIVTED